MLTKPLKNIKKRQNNFNFLEKLRNVKLYSEKLNFLN